MSTRWPRAMRPETAARYLDIRRSTFYELAALPGFPEARPLRPGGRRRYDRLEIAAWWERRKAEAAAERGETPEMVETARRLLRGA